MKFVQFCYFTLFVIQGICLYMCLKWNISPFFEIHESSDKGFYAYEKKKVMFQNCLVINHFNHRVTRIYFLAYSSDTWQCSKLNHIAKIICFPFQFLSLLLAFLVLVDLIQEASADRSVQITAVFVALAIKVGSYVSFWDFF